MTKDLWPICLDIYRQLYKEATPSADFDELMRTGVTKQKDFFMHYYLDDDRQAVIIREHCEKHKLNRLQRSQVDGQIWLGCSPRGTKPESIKTTQVD